jgi:hypothetical protein
MCLFLFQSASLNFTIYNVRIKLKIHLVICLFIYRYNLSLFIVVCCPFNIIFISIFIFYCIKSTLAIIFFYSFLIFNYKYIFIILVIHISSLKSTHICNKLLPILFDNMFRGIAKCSKKINY